MTSEYRPTGRATEIAFDVLGLPPGLNGTHGHWRTAAGERKKWRELGAWHAKKAWLKAGGGPLYMIYNYPIFLFILDYHLMVVIMLLIPTPTK